MKTRENPETLTGMEFKIEAAVIKDESNTVMIGVCVTESLRDRAKRIKDLSDKNKTLFNEYARKFFHQLVEKFEQGEIDNQE